MAYDPCDNNGDFPPPRIYADVDFVNLCFWGTTPGGCAIWSRQKFPKTRAGYRAADRKRRLISKRPHNQASFTLTISGMPALVNLDDRQGRKLRINPHEWRPA